MGRKILKDFLIVAVGFGLKVLKDLLGKEIGKRVKG